MIIVKSPSIETHIGQQLRRRREELKMSQYELAQALQITPQQLSKYENGIDRLPASRLYYICRLLTITPDYFFQGLEDQ
ncbi:helix-turn-helix domain-containing protein [Candidatus Odyssella thessalonicensis]|uniref:helix-turn-helix domain-containing protein n=1 Tax=Candidatus Odyssella thessalonicensis TaxID=84647 RepID=UPI000225B191|nr:helix-turn-helix transcriptional regulator [Candidatus Odyssella thessalonicensis]